MDYNKINTLLTDKRLSVPMLADKIGMTKRGLYASLENKTLTISTLEKIAEVLEVPVTVFFESSSNEESEFLRKKTEELKASYNSLLDVNAKLENEYNNLLKISKLNEKVADSANKEAAAYYNIICMLYADVFNLYLESDSYIETDIFKDHPEIEDNEDPTLLEKYKTEDRLRQKFLTLLQKIRPMIKGDIELKITSIEEIK